MAFVARWNERGVAPLAQRRGEGWFGRLWVGKCDFLEVAEVRV